MLNSNCITLHLPFHEMKLLYMVKHNVSLVVSFTCPYYNLIYSSPKFSLAFKDNVLILLGLLLCFSLVSMGMSRNWTRFLLTTVVGVSTRYDLGFFDGLITVPVQTISMMYTVAPDGRGFNC